MSIQIINSQNVNALVGLYENVEMVAALLQKFEGKLLNQTFQKALIKLDESATCDISLDRGSFNQHVGIRLAVPFNKTTFYIGENPHSYFIDAYASNIVIILKMDGKRLEVAPTMEEIEKLISDKLEKYN